MAEVGGTQNVLGQVFTEKEFVCFFFSKKSWREKKERDAKLQSKLFQL